MSKILDILNLYEEQIFSYNGRYFMFSKGRRYRYTRNHIWEITESESELLDIIENIDKIKTVSNSELVILKMTNSDVSKIRELYNIFYPKYIGVMMQDNQLRLFFDNTYENSLVINRNYLKFLSNGDILYFNDILKDV